MMHFPLILILLKIWVPNLTGGTPGMNNSPAIQTSDSLSHEVWDNLLKKYVTSEGLVDYSGFLNDAGVLDEYLKKMGDNVPDKSSGKDNQLAYYINLYNAATVKLILDNYPLESIKDITNPWDRKWISTGQEMLSLGQIEHSILRRMDEPRIHFAINCASFSCPKLLNSAFTAKDLDRQLDLVTREFVNDPARNRISSNLMQLSKIFKWYKKDFTEKGSLPDYIKAFTDIELTPRTKITYLNYNWKLNEAP